MCSIWEAESAEQTELGNENKIFSTLTPDSPHHLSLVQECVSLEDKIRCKGTTHEVLDGNSVGVHGLSKSIVKKKCLRNAQNHQSTVAAAEIASSTSWLKLRDMALDHGPWGLPHCKHCFED